MEKDKYKEQFADAAARAFQAVYQDVFDLVGEDKVFSSEVIYSGLQKPKDPSMGRFAFPVFPYVKLLGDKPQQIAATVAEKANHILADNTDKAVLRCESVSGFLNACIDPTYLACETLTGILESENHYGDSRLGEGKTYLVEYSSPNIAKPFGMGHLRSTILGHSLRRVYKKLGYHVIGINYPGDWGTQFGKMIVAFRKWGDKSTYEGNTVKNLLALYVKFHQEVEQDESLNDQAREAFRKLEDGDPQAMDLWERFKEISNAEFDRVYDLLGIEFDLVYGESFLNDKMDAVIERFSKAGLTSISQGALVVDLGEPDRPPALLRKADGATLYATRDLTGMIYRWAEYPFYESLYVVNSAQSDHFKQCFKVVEMLEDAENLPPEKRMHGRIKHVDFGWVRFAGKMMSTRRGNTVLLEDVISEAADLARRKITEKNPNLDNIDETALLIGVGAVIFSQISVRRQKDVDFQWEEVLSFEGETGPYLQYTHARLCSLLRKYNRDVVADVDYSLLDKPEEQRVIELLADFPQVVINVADQYEPFYLAGYLLRLAGAFNTVYQRKDTEGNIDKIISEDDALSSARIAMVRAVQLVVNEGLFLLGLKAPQEM